MSCIFQHCKVQYTLPGQVRNTYVSVEISFSPVNDPGVMRLYLEDVLRRLYRPYKYLSRDLPRP